MVLADNICVSKLDFSSLIDVRMVTKTCPCWQSVEDLFVVLADNTQVNLNVGVSKSVNLGPY